MMFAFNAASFPTTPGVYLMKDERKRIIYVGKAKDLRKRLASYFRAERTLTPKTRVLVGRIHSIETLTTATEKEALLLEASLIKKHRPRFNVVLRDDKSYVLFRLTKGTQYPRLTMTRKVVRDGSVYYGPFTSAHAAKRTWKLLNRAFQLRKCRDSQFRNRVRPCLYHHIGQCLGPCVNPVLPQDYAALVRQVELFLAGRTGELVEKLRAQMVACSDELDFERAARLRDQIRAVEATVERQAAVLKSKTDMDIIAVAETADGLGLGLLFVRRGRLLGKKTFFWPGMGLEDGPEAVAGFLGQFYWKTRLIPERILTPWPLEADEALAEMLAERRDGPVYLAVPRTFAEKQLLDMARTNAAQDALGHRGQAELPLLVGKALRLPGEARVVECVDVSHLSGKGMRAGMVVFEDGAPLKERYRTYSFPELEGSADDYAALAAWAKRRVKAGEPWPDVALVDGGRGQVSAVSRALEEAGAPGVFPIAGIAKAEGQPGHGPDRRAGALDDRIFLPGRSNPLPIRPGSSVLLYLQRVRDTAHSFVIGRQRRTRTADMLQSELASIPGVGPKTARLLWDAFQSIAAMRGASVDDLRKVPGLGAKRAASVQAALKRLREE